MNGDKLEVTVTVTHLTGGTEYAAEYWYRNERYTLTSRTSLRDLLKQLTTVIAYEWEMSVYGHKIIGDFDDSDLTADDGDAWATPLVEFIGLSQG